MNTNHAMILFAVLLAACSGNGGGGDTRTSTLPGMFELVAPTNHAEDQSPAAEFRWTASENAASYTLQIDDDAAFLTPLVYQVVDIPADTTQFTPPANALDSGEQYFWRVFAGNTLGDTYAANGPFAMNTLQGATLAWGRPTSMFVDDMAVNEEAVYAVGTVSSDDDPGQWRIEKRDRQTGVLVDSFGELGVILRNPSAHLDTVVAVALDQEALYVMGIAGDQDSQFHWRVEKRRLSDGGLVQAFGNNGVLDIHGSDSVSSSLHTGTLEGSALYLAGMADGEPRIEKRQITDGALLWWKTDALTRYQKLLANGDALFVARIGGEAGSFDTHWIVDKRAAADGSRITDFGDNGYVTIDPGSGTDYPTAIAVDDSAIYIAGVFNQSTFDDAWRIEKRNLGDGALVGEFNSGGIWSANPSDGGDKANAMLLMGTRLYVFGSDTVEGNARQRIVKMHSTDGTLVDSFGDGGIFTFNPTDNDDSYNVAVPFGTAVYIAGLHNLQGYIERRSK